MLRLLACAILTTAGSASAEDPALPGSMEAALALQRMQTPAEPSEDSFHQCNLSRVEDGGCPMSSFGRKKTIVYPGGKTSCIVDGYAGGEYRFVVTPGDPDKLLFNLQAGGACWDDVTTWMTPACTRNITEAWSFSQTRLSQGIFDTSERRNAFKSFTMVEVLYCSGDSHFGSVTRHGGAGAPPEWRSWKQSGYHNLEAALNWTLANTGHLTSLIIQGESAGALGAQAWANHLLQERFRNRYGKAAVVLDSYAGLFPEDTTAPVLQKFGACDLPIFTPAVRLACHAGVMTMPMLMKDTIGNNLEVPFAFIQSKEDNVQKSFYDLLSWTILKKTFDRILSPVFYAGTNSIFEQYKVFPNFALFYVQSSDHMWLRWPYTRWGRWGRSAPSPASRSCTSGSTLSPRVRASRVRSVRACESPWRTTAWGSPCCIATKRSSAKLGTRRHSSPEPLRRQTSSLVR
jgi:hypothetical protein